MLSSLVSCLLLAAVSTPSTSAQGSTAQTQIPIAAGSLPRSAFDVLSLSRSIDLGGASTRSASIYTLNKQAGSTSAEEESAFIFAVNDDGDPAIQGRLAWMDATVGKTGASRKALAIRAIGHDPSQHVRFYALAMPPSSEDQVTVTVNTIHNHASVAKPSSVAQDSNVQGLYWVGDLLGGAGAIGHQLQEGAVKVRVKSSSPRLTEDVVPAGWTANHPAGSATITFTNSESVISGSALAAVHYDHPEPVISAPTLSRTAQVSHWGNHLSIQDDYAFHNGGPTLRGHFSRLTHQAISYMKRTGQGAASYPHVLLSLQMPLPPNIFSPYFIDEVGNVSTSKFRPSPKVILGRKSNAASILELTPRYPLMGGWNYTFSVGYKQPLGDVLRYDGSQSRYTIAVPFVTPLKGVALDDVELRIILPEGASSITVSPPFPLATSEQSTSYTYLDTAGRPTIILRKADVTEKHALDVLVSYSYGTIDMARKPAVVGSLIAAGFALAGMIKRFRWSFI